MRFLFAVIAVLCPLLSIADDSVADRDTQKHTDLTFATIDGQALKLDLYLPNEVRSPPLVVWIHGGSWRAGSKQRSPLTKLTESGFAVASINYRFTDVALFPAQIHDCKAAVRWLRANADQYGYDANWIAVAGSSAGGHLALLMGTSAGVTDLEGNVGGNLDQSSSVQAIVDYFGPSDFVLRGKTQPDRAYTTKSGSFALLGGLKNGKIEPEIETIASPTHYVDQNDPPLLIFHGDKDQTVLLDQSERMAQVYRGKGAEVKLVVIKEAGHGGQQFFNDKNQQLVRDFLIKHRPSKTQNAP